MRTCAWSRCTEHRRDEMTLRAARETFHFLGGEFVLRDMPQETLKKYRKRLWFHHGDLVFYTGLVRGNFTRDYPEIKHDECLWASVETCLDVFNKTRKRHWGVRQVIQMVAEDKKGRMEMRGRRSSLYFPVVIRATQGHNQSLAKNLTPTSRLPPPSTPPWTRMRLTRQPPAGVCLWFVWRMCQRSSTTETTRDSFQSIFQAGFGISGSGRVHKYFATCPVASEEYRSGVRAYAPIEIKWDAKKLLRSGCLLFTARSEGVLCREACARNTIKEEVPYSLRLDDAPEIPRGSTA